MGTVYRVYDAETGLEVALKTLNGLSPRNRQWIKGEFRSLSALVHPNLVQLYELVIDDTHAFFTMELVRGVDFSKFVRGSAAAADGISRPLRESARQLAHALAACHSADKLHRDVKPSNVLVTDAGRVVLLDFGLVAPMHEVMEPQQDGTMVGTPGYVAPEQAWGQPLTAAADWYGFGATLYEAATGRLPISGRYAILPIEGRRPVPPRQLRADLAPDLDDLIVRLLSPKAEDRPPQTEILNVLGGGSLRGVVSIPPSDRSRSTAPFVNRTEQLAALDASWRRARAGETVVVCVQGPSGIGKTEVVRRFLQRSEVASAAWVLRGRCHPEETVSFNALDGALDDLASAFQQLDPSPLASLTTDEADALIRLFPILASSAADAAPPADVSSAASPQEIRHRALAALRRVLASIAALRTPLIWLDDLQWGDTDSGALLRDLLSTSSGLPLLLVASYRDNDIAIGHALEVLQRDPSVLGGDRAQRLALLPLSERDSYALIQELVFPAPGQSPSRLAELCKEAAGLPFLLREVASYLHGGGDSTLGAVQVSDMLEHRMSQLSREALDIVEIVSIAGSPIEHRTVLEAGGLGAASVPLFAMLERLALLRTTAGATRTTEVYHHRIREHALLRMDETKIRERHAAIANALLNEANPNLQRIVEHYERAGSIEAVRRYVIPAARQAQDGYAFDRAVVLYRKAIEVGAGDLDRPELHTQLGHALANAGQARAAGESYERATSILAGRPEPELDRVLALRRAAAEQYLQSGHDRPAIQALREVLATHAVRMPGTRGEALALGVVLRVRLLFRQLDVPPRDAADVPPELLERFDVTWAVGVRLAMVNHAQVSYFAARCLDIALETREPARLALALSWEASALSMLGPVFAARVQHMLALARQMVESSGPYERAMVAALTAATEWLGGRFRSALELDDTASELLARARHEFHWERALFDTWSLSALALLGEYRELSARIRTALEEAERRDDRYLARNCYLGEPTLAWLAQDRPDWALEKANQAIAWSPPEYTTQHYHHYLALAFALLYKGDAAAAFTLSDEVWPHLRNNLFLTLATVREELVHLRGSIALALAESITHGLVGGAGQTSASLLRRVRHDATSLRRARTPLGAAWSELLLAGVDNVEGRRTASVKRLARAVNLLQRCQLAGYEHAARFWLGRLTRGSDGAELEQRSIGWFASQGVCAPERFMRMLAPGFAR